MDPPKELAGAEYVSLETFRRNGDPVDTTVWVVEDGGVLYVRTSPQSGKAKRIRRNNHVRIARSNMRGKVSGEWADGEAMVLEGKDSERIVGLFRKKYGLQIKLLGALGRLRRGPRVEQVVIGIRLQKSG